MQGRVVIPGTRFFSRVREFLRCGAHEPPSDIQIQRFADNPIIHPGMPGLTSDNINGPSLIRVPNWVENPLGRYYLYFADHRGDSIRLAYADRIEGPWKIHPEGALHLDRTPARDHIASPDVHVDVERKEILMYFHGVSPNGGEQLTWLATSRDGLAFRSGAEPLGPFYFRVFRHGGWYYAIAKDGNSGGLLLRSKDGVTPFERGPQFIPRLRHTAVLIEGDALLLFFSRVGDRPERIHMGRIDLGEDWTRWEKTMSTPVTVIEPATDYEGVNFPLRMSRPGPAVGVRQLRDPAIFREDGRTWLLYSVAGESGIAGVRLYLP